MQEYQAPVTGMPCPRASCAVQGNPSTATSPARRRPAFLPASLLTYVNHQSSASHVSGLIAEVNIYQPDSQSRENFSIDCNCKQIAKRLLSHNRAQGSACKPRRCPGGLKGPPLQPAWTVARTTLGCIPEPGAPSTLPARQLRHRTFRGPLCD
jgi:hypothetical protein